MVPLRFIRALYCVGQNLEPLPGRQAALRSCPTTNVASKAFPTQNPALFQASGFAFHPYPQGTAPDIRARDEPDYADLPQLDALERTLDGALSAYGATYRFPLYDTEFGYHTDPPETGAPAITPTLAADYLNWAEYITWRNPRLVSWDQYLLADPSPAPGSFDTGLEFYDGTKKILYEAFRMPIYLPTTTATSGHVLDVWGCVRPAHYYMIGRAASRQVAEIQFEPRSGTRFRTLKQVDLSDPYGYFYTPVDFPSSGNVRISWSYPHHGPKIHSRMVRINLLPNGNDPRASS